MASSSKTKLGLPESLTHMTTKISTVATEVQQLIESDDFRNPETTHYQIKAALNVISTYCDMAEEILDDERENLIVYYN